MASSRVRLTRCSVAGCINDKSNRHLSFFSLPSDNERRNIWLRVIGRTDLMENPNLKPASYFVCSAHFETDVILQRPFLKLDAIPTKYIPDIPREDDDTRSQKFETMAMDVATQTKYSQVNVTSILRLKNPTSESVAVQADDENKNSNTQTPLSLSSNTPRKRTLHTRLKNSEKKIRKLENHIKKLEKEVEAKNTLSLDRLAADDDEVTKRFSKLIEWQINLSKKRKGHRYDPEFKLFALNLHFSSPQTYRTLQSFLKLPGESTLQKFKLFMTPKFEDKTLDYLESKLKSLPNKAKYCVICVDEMVLKRHLHYDTRQDNIKGLHNINGAVTNEIASNACVIMLRGIMVNWKQPIAYSLLASAKPYEDVETWIDEVILKLSNIGVEVMAIVSDQGSNFDKFAKDIKKVTTEKPYFDYNGRKIYYIFDVPHMIKCLRNNLITNHFHYDDKIISWKFLSLLYSKQQAKDLRLAPKITDAHINPNNFQKMRVKYATQVFSSTVVAAMKTLIYTKDIPKEAEPTIDFFEKINNLFDVLNSNTVKSGNKYKTAFAFKEFQTKVLEDALEMFKKIKATSVKSTNKSNEPVNNTNKIKTFKNFQISIQAIIMLCKELKEKGFNFVFTRRLNQDPLENFFGSIRQQGSNCRHPTPIQFMRAFSKLFLCNMLKKSRDTNCEEDICELLLKENNVFTRPTSRHFCDTPNALPSQVALNGETDYRFDVPTQNALTYVAGYLLFKCMKKHCCPVLLAATQGIPDLDDTKMFAHFKAYNKDSSFYGGLKVPPEKFIDYIKQLEHIFINTFESCVIGQPGSTLYNNMKNVMHANLCPCFPHEYLLKLFIRFRIFTTLKFNNRTFKEGKKFIQHYIKVKQL